MAKKKNKNNFLSKTDDDPNIQEAASGILENFADIFDLSKFPELKKNLLANGEATTIGDLIQMIAVMQEQFPLRAKMVTAALKFKEEHPDEYKRKVQEQKKQMIYDEKTDSIRIIDEKIEIKVKNSLPKITYTFNATLGVK